MKIDVSQKEKIERQDGTFQYTFDLYRDDTLIDTFELVVDRWTTEQQIRALIEDRAREVNQTNIKRGESRDKIPPDFNGRINIPGNPRP